MLHSMSGIMTIGLVLTKLRLLKKGNFRERKTLESWHTAATENADNNSKPLPKQYTSFK